MNAVIDMASILLFDQNIATLQQLSTIFQAEGWTVTAAAPLETIISDVQTHSPDLILLAIDSLEFDGIELCKQLKSNSKINSIPIILITDITNRDAQLKGFSVGISDYITIPFQAEEVLGRVRTHLQLYQLQQSSLASSTLSSSQVVEIVQREKNTLLTPLVSSLVHDINNPLGNITGNINYVKDYLKDLLGLIELYQEHYPNPVAEITDEIETIDLDYLQEDLPSILSAMEKAGERLCQISNSLRTFGRFESDRKVNFNLHDGIDSAILMIKSRLKGNKSRSNIEIIKNYGTLPEVPCYPGSLNQVFLNLINNAIEALDEKAEKQPAEPNHKPTITIKTELTTSEPSRLRILIKDNGLGIPETIQHQLFDDLFTTKSPEKNSGIGLSISRKIIEEKHQGHLNYYSTPDSGTEFIIELPIE